MYKSVILESYIHKGPEGYDITYDPIEYISDFHIFHRHLFSGFRVSGVYSLLGSYLSISIQNKADGISVGIWIERYHILCMIGKVV